MENQKPVIDGAKVQKYSITHELLNYAVKEVIEPKSKELMSSMFTGIISMFADAATKSVDKLVYPDGAPKRIESRSTSRNGVYISSNATDYTVHSRSYEPAPKKDPISTRSSYNVSYIWVEEESQAKAIIGSLKEDIENYKKAKVATLYEMIKMPTTFADFKFGWTEEHLSQIGYYREVSGENRGKFFIDLPRPVNIENV